MPELASCLDYDPKGHYDIPILQTWQDMVVELLGIIWWVMQISVYGPTFNDIRHNCSIKAAVIDIDSP